MIGNIKLWAFIIGILTPLVIILIYSGKIKIKIPTKKGVSSTNSGTKKPFINKTNLQNMLLILLAIFVLMVCIRSVVWVGSGIKKLFYTKPTTTQCNVNSNLIYIKDDTYIEFGKLSGFTYVLPESCEFELLEATQPYCVTNDYGKSICVSANEDASTLLGYSKGNRKLKFHSSNGQICRLKISIIR